MSSDREKCVSDSNTPAMAKKDLVPCFYTGQDWRREPPAESHPRQDVHYFKSLKLGKFIESGKFFLFHARRIKEVIVGLFDGPLGVGNLLPFAKAHNYGDKLHYEIPMAGDRGVFARHRRKLIRVSARSGMRTLAAAVLPTQTFASRLLAG